MAATLTFPRATPLSTSRMGRGHTGCVILAPHLVGAKKKDLGLPILTRRPRGGAATEYAGGRE